MPLERSAGALIFRKEKGDIKYLLLHYPSGSRTSEDYWDFPKGHIEKGEKPELTVVREVEEETGLGDIKFIEGFKEVIKYFFKFQGKTVFKIVVFYLGETKTKKVKISREHIGYKWVSCKEALEQLRFKNAKEILRKANGYLMKHKT